MKTGGDKFLVAKMQFVRRASEYIKRVNLLAKGPISSKTVEHRPGVMSIAMISVRS